MSKGTKVRHVRVPDETWDAAISKAQAEGTELAKVIRGWLEEYVTPPPPQR